MTMNISGPTIIYLDGVRMFSHNSAGAMRGDTLNIIRLFAIQNVVGASSTVSFYNFRFYTQALTAEEVAKNYAIDRKRFGI